MKTRLYPFLVAAPLLFGCSASPDPAVESSSAAPVEVSVKPGANDNFLAPDVDVESYIDRFEGESREIAVQRDALVATLELKPGLALADIGAGTGLFLEPFARALAPEGRLYAIDIAPGFVEHMEARVADEGLSGVEVRLGGERSIELPDACIDAAFVCDTYHHFEYPASMLASLHSALRPGGRLVVVDFERIPGVTREWLLGHVRADKATFRSEIEAAGFVFEDEVEIDGLEENYVLRFRRP